MLAELLPAEIHVATSAEPGDPAGLLGTEAGAVATADPGRREEFAAGRACARAALAALGHPPAPISVGRRREPLWPDGVVGSIAHCGRHAAAAVALARDHAALGIDIEANRPLPAGAASLALAPGELAAVPARTGADPGALLLSSREALFKAWWPLCRTWLDPLDVTIRLLPAERAFEVLFTAPEALLTAERTGMTGIEGRVGWDRRHVAAVAWLPGRPV